MNLRPIYSGLVIFGGMSSASSRSLANIYNIPVRPSSSRLDALPSERRQTGRTQSWPRTVPPYCFLKRQCFLFRSCCFHYGPHDKITQWPGPGIAPVISYLDEGSNSNGGGGLVMSCFFEFSPRVFRLHDQFRG